jgi:hypothetical protein
VLARTVVLSWIECVSILVVVFWIVHARFWIVCFRQVLVVVVVLQFFLVMVVWVATVMAKPPHRSRPIRPRSCVFCFDGVWFDRGALFWIMRVSSRFGGGRPATVLCGDGGKVWQNTAQVVLYFLVLGCGGFSGGSC